MDISNTTGPKGKSQAENKGTWSRVERKLTTSPSDANIRDLSRERPAFDETELKTKKKKRRASSSHGRAPSAPPLTVDVAQPRQSP